ncbi:MAG TPA: hypothetical protein VNZ22_22420 [Bacillota bacterium]|nr:hypothetical protein [Bacillota bacterium]
MKNENPGKPVERLFPFVLRSRILLVGRDTLRRSKSKLHFVLLTEDLSENSRQAMLSEFAPYPIVQRYTAAELEQFFGIRGAKVIGFAKSNLAQSVYAELKAFRLNPPRSGSSEKLKPPGPSGTANPEPAV